MAAHQMCESVHTRWQQVTMNTRTWFIGSLLQETVSVVIDLKSYAAISDKAQCSTGLEMPRASSCSVNTNFFKNTLIYAGVMIYL